MYTRKLEEVASFFVFFVSKRDHLWRVVQNPKKERQNRQTSIIKAHRYFDSCHKWYNFCRFPNLYYNRKLRKSIAVHLSLSLTTLRLLQMATMIHRYCLLICPFSRRGANTQAIDMRISSTFLLQKRNYCITRSIARLLIKTKNIFYDSHHTKHTTVLFIYCLVFSRSMLMSYSEWRMK